MRRSSLYLALARLVIRCPKNWRKTAVSGLRAAERRGLYPCASPCQTLVLTLSASAFGRRFSLFDHAKSRRPSGFELGYLNSIKAGCQVGLNKIRTQVILPL